MPFSANWTYSHVPTVYLFHSGINFTVDVRWFYRCKSEIQAAVLEGCQSRTRAVVMGGRAGSFSIPTPLLPWGCGVGTGSQSILRALQALRKSQQDSGRGAHSQRRAELGFWLRESPFPAAPAALAAQLHHKTAPWDSLISGSVLPTPWISLDFSWSLNDRIFCLQNGRQNSSFSSSFLFHTTQNTEWTLCFWESIQQLGYIFVFKLLLFKWLFKQTHWPLFCVE